MKRTCQGMTIAELEEQIEIRREILRESIIFKHNLVCPLPVQADIYRLQQAVAKAKEAERG